MLKGNMGRRKGPVDQSVEKGEELRIWVPQELSMDGMEVRMRIRKSQVWRESLSRHRV